MEESRSRVQLLIVSEILWVSIFLCRGWNITYLDFSTLTQFDPQILISDVYDGNIKELREYLQ